MEMKLKNGSTIKFVGDDGPITGQPPVPELVEFWKLVAKEEAIMLRRWGKHELKAAYLKEHP